ncbi:B-4DMT family transporter [Nocardia aurea]|uniref:B-4DMT family transporter n=1 Tax=Nocardia aurea TaxID=2144174 RepID=A0ABV3FNZ7_9NOCA
MTAWVLRAFALGVLVVGLRIGLGFGMVYWPTHGSSMRILCLVVLLAVIVAWGVLDGRADRLDNPDPERGSDLTIRWLKAAVAGGVGSGLVSWMVDFFPKMDLSDNGLLFEVTAGASFIILLIFIPALIGVGIGRMVAGRAAEKSVNAESERHPVASAH